MMEWLVHIDKELMLFLNGMHSPFFDWIMWWSSDRLIWIPLYLFIAFLFYRKFNTSALLPIILTIVAVGMSDLISSHYIKEVVHRLRPDHDPEIGTMVHTLKGYTGGLYGFVSAHAANSFALATMCLLFLRNKTFSICIYAWAILVSYSRIYLGVHFPADVICGAMLGSILAIILYISWSKNSILHPES
jgi:undecaprenyl-diphosphatase